MSRFKLFLLSTGLIIFSTAAAQDTARIRQIADDILSTSEMYENLRVLCKKVGPRLSGSSGAQLAISETARMLREAGADTVYLQPCMVPHWVRGSKEKAVLLAANGTRTPLRICALGNSEGTGTKGVKAPVIEVHSMQELADLGNAVKGKIVFFNFAMNPRYVQTFRAYGEAGIARRSGPAEAARYGAAGVLVRSLASNLDDYPHTGATQYNDSFPKIPAAAISTNDAELLSRKLRLRMIHELQFFTYCQMLPDVPSFNVIGEIRGSSVKPAIITVGGHLDSWDLAEGAHDDGAGCMQSIEVIRVLKKLGFHPKNTIRAVLFMNEENGLRGGKAYLAAAKLKNESHLFALESDAGGFTPRAFGFSLQDDKLQKIQPWVKLLEPYGIGGFHTGGGGADIGPLRETGAVLCGLEPDSQRYFDVHHASTDVFESVSKRELALGAICMSALIYLVDQIGL